MPHPTMPSPFIHCLRASLQACAMITSLLTSGSLTAAAPWLPDLGDGRYKNPVLHADYSDPDVIRVGEDFYLTASSFAHAPGLPLLHSRDLVNWTIINHVLPLQPPVAHFEKSRHGQGVWAPALRFHAGKFWLFYPDPDFGLYLTQATDPAGDWSAPVLILPGKGLIDPCPFWDGDGQLYLVHGWAKSRAGIANLLTLHRLSVDGLRPLDAGTVIIDANQMPGWHTLEGPKLYQRHGFYYIFAPAGGVSTGYQAVFRAKNIYGPYESRIVLEQGQTAINGPHQGAWVDTPTGEDWFLHFQDKGPYGRVVHLQPMRWHDDWPLMGTAAAGQGAATQPGEPVLTHRKPDVGRTYPSVAPQTSDDFAAPTLGRQWQWNANPRPGWASLTARPGFLRLAAIPAPAQRNDGSPAPHSLYDAPNFLLQKFPAPAFTATTVLEFSPAAVGESAGLTVFGYNYALLALRLTDDGLRLGLFENHAANERGHEEKETASLPVSSGRIFLRVTLDEQARAQFAYSLDGHAFTPIGTPFQATVDRWVGAKFGLIATTLPGATATGHADFEWLTVTPPVR